MNGGRSAAASICPGSRSFPVTPLSFSGVGPFSLAAGRPLRGAGRRPVLADQLLVPEVMMLARPGAADGAEQHGVHRAPNPDAGIHVHDDAHHQQPAGERMDQAGPAQAGEIEQITKPDRKSTRLNSSHVRISYA